MAPKFGTSGLRGLVSDLTDDLVADYVRAYLTACDHGGKVWVGHDRRASSPHIASVVVDTIRGQGVDVMVAGVVPTPALALAAGGAGAIMITGSHIPDDRNGMKFYTRAGEITKNDESAIMAARGQADLGLSGQLIHDDQVGARYVARYIDAFGDCLTGRRIGVYTHSAAGRDLLMGLMRGTGAEVVELGRSAAFVPIDTEAVDAEKQALFHHWAQENELDAIVSTDGDSDRPLMTDETGQMIKGDILAQIAAEVLGAKTIVTPISSNSGVDSKGFECVIRTKIGSPYVIEAMQRETSAVVGYEASGGFILGFAANGPTGPIAPLLTRDSFLPLIAVLAATKGKLSDRIGLEPPVFATADRLTDVPLEPMRLLMGKMVDSRCVRHYFLAQLEAEEASIDMTDGVRMTCDDGRVFHVRPSGNAPELRLYVEASDPVQAETALKQGLTLLNTMISSACC